MVPCIVLGGTSSGVGKTSISIGIMAALRWAASFWCHLRSITNLKQPSFSRGLMRMGSRRKRGLVVQAFKVGPG